MRILFVDPGKVTGAGILTTGGGQTFTFSGWEVEHFDFLRWAEVYVTPVSLDRVVCEGFSVSTRTTKEDPSSVGGLWSVKQIGLLEYWCEVRGIPFEQQMPGDKAFGSNDKLKALGWYTGAKGERGHRRDAARHALKWGVQHKVIDPRRLISEG